MEGHRSSGATITRLDGTTIDTTALTQRIDALTRVANVHGLTVTIFNGAEKVYSRAFGVADLSAGKPLRTDTELYGASLSKAVFSAHHGAYEPEPHHRSAGLALVRAGSEAAHTLPTRGEVRLLR